MKIKERIIPDWISKFQWYYDHYSGKLTRLYGLDKKDVEVYVFLFTQKIFFGSTEWNPYQILNQLNKINNDYTPNEMRSNHNTRSVGESLTRLESLGFVKKRENSQKQRKERGGASGKHLFFATEIIDLEKITQNRLDTTRGDMLDVLSSLQQVEEIMNSKKEEKESGKK